jgi:hypothetical protein
MPRVYETSYTGVQNPWNALWKSRASKGARMASGQKNKGAGVAPESRKYLDWNELKVGTYFFPFFPFLVLFFAAFFLAGMVSVTSSLAGFVDSAGSCVLACPPLEGRGLALPDSVDCLESLLSVDRFQKIWFPWDGIVSSDHGAVLFSS